MLYEFTKIIARIAFRFYCRDLVINNRELLKIDGPLLLASNHPNSFLDAIILCTLFDKPVYSLARGDVFKNSFIAKILMSAYFDLEYYIYLNHISSSLTSINK